MTALGNVTGSGSPHDPATDTARPEIELLIACTRPSAEGRDARIEALLGNGIDWTELIRTAIAHGVSPLLAHRLLTLEPAALPEELRPGLQEHLQDNIQRNLALVDALLEALGAMQERGVTALPFKGQTLGAVAYDDFTVRRVGDLDILVRKGDLPAVWTGLEQLGYREVTVYEIGRPMTPVEHAGYLEFQCEYAFVRRTDQVVIEPHWALAPPALAISLPYEEFFRNARTTPLDGKAVPTLALPDLLIVACVHASKHEWTRLQWICDVAGLVERQPDLDVSLALEVARAHGVERMVLLGLGLAHRIYGMPLTPPAMQRLMADPTAVRLVEMLARNLFHEDRETSPFADVTRLRMQMRERWTDKVAYAFRTVTTPTEKHYRLASLPPWLRFLYWPLKPLHDFVAMPLWQLGKVTRLRLMAGRTSEALGAADRVLIIDWVPHIREGAGSPRLNRILRLLAGAGYRVTLHPVEPCLEQDEALYSDIPSKVEVIRGRGIDHIEAFLSERAREFGTIIVGRPMNMARLGPAFDRHPEFIRDARLVYDSEALFAMRTISQRELLGDSLTPDEQSHLLAQEVGLATRARAVLAVSRAEQKLFRDHGAPNVFLVGYPIDPAPTPRSFAERDGLLFVGRIAEDGWPNTDALVWYRDHVLPRLAERGCEPLLTVAGKTGARQLADHIDDRMRYLGVVDDLVPLYDRTRVFIAPTRFAAGTPAKLYEAAAHGVPIVATRLLADQLGWQPGEDLLASEVGDAEAFAENIVALYTQPELWARLRTNALARIAAECAPSEVLAQLEQAMRS